MGKERLLMREDSDEQDEVWVSDFSWEERERAPIGSPIRLGNVCMQETRHLVVT